MNVSYDQFHSTVQSIPESATLGEASVQFVAAVADLKARVLQEQEVIDSEATTRPTPPFLAAFGGCPSQVCKRTVPTGSRFADIHGAEAETSDGDA